MELKNFNKFEDNPSNLKRVADEAVKRAFREAKALGLDITYANDGAILRESPDGTIQKLGDLGPQYHPKQVTKGDVVYVQKQ